MGSTGESMIKWLKKHHIIHDWSKWCDPQEVYTQIILPGDRLAKFVDYWIQSRECKTCKKWRQRKIIK